MPTIKPNRKAVTEKTALAVSHRTRLAPKLSEDEATRPADAPMVRAAISAFEEALGGRAAFADTLLLLPELTETQQQILRLVGDPQYDGTSLATLCAKVGISVGQLFGAYRDAALARAHVKAIALVESQIDATTKDLLKYCVDHTLPCPTCFGSGQLQKKPTTTNPEPSTYPCYTCREKGVIPSPSSLEHQKVALELVGLVNKKPGVQVNTQVNNVTAGGVVSQAGGSLELLQQAAASILYQRPRKVIDAEAVVVDSAVK